MQRAETRNPARVTCYRTGLGRKVRQKEANVALVMKMRLDTRKEYGGPQYQDEAFMDRYKAWAELSQEERAQQPQPTPPPGVSQVEVHLQAVTSTGPDDPNKDWSAATPVAQLTATITNPAAFRQLEAGAEYYVELRKVTPGRARKVEADEDVSGHDA